MAVRQISDRQLASITTSKIYFLSTGSEVLFQIGSSNRAFEASNLGTFNVTYGQSNLLANSGIIIASNNGAKFWDTVSDSFQMYFRVSQTGSSHIVIHEYGGNE